MYRLENSSAASKNHHSSLTSTSYRKTKQYKLKQNMKFKKKEEGKKCIETDEKRQTDINEVKINLFQQENKNEDKRENKHAVTLSIYTQTAVKTVKLSVQKGTCY